MSKFFYKGRPDIMGKHNQGTYKPEPNVKPGSKLAPLNLTVTTAEKKSEVEKMLAEHGLFAKITLDESAQENLDELTSVLNRPKPQVFEKKPQRNDPCLCGSGKKYKKCCA